MFLQVGEAQVNVPIKAECAVPKLTLSTAVLEFGSCFLRHPYKRTIRLANESKLPGKFEVLPQDPQSMGLAVFSCEPMSGGIAAMGEQELEISLQAHTLGRVQIPVRVKVVGSRGKPLEFAIDARCLGPTLLFGPEESRCASGLSVCRACEALGAVLHALCSCDEGGQGLSACHTRA